MDPLIIVFGLGVGMLVGLTGMGGGSLMTPILIIVFGYNPVTAVGTDLAYGAVTKTLGGWRHFRQRTVFFPLAVWMGVGSVPAAVGGAYVLHAAVLLWAAALAHVVAGNVDYGLMGTILIGSLPGVWVGSNLAVRVPTASLRLGLAIVMIGSGLGLLSKAGAGIPGYVLAAVPVLLAVVVGWKQLSERAKRLAAAKAPLPRTLSQPER